MSVASFVLWVERSEIYFVVFVWLRTMYRNLWTFRIFQSFRNFWKSRNFRKSRYFRNPRNFWNSCNIGNFRHSSLDFCEFKNSLTVRVETFGTIWIFGFFFYLFWEHFALSESLDSMILRVKKGYTKYFFFSTLETFGNLYYLLIFIRNMLRIS